MIFLKFFFPLRTIMLPPRSAALDIFIKGSVTFVSLIATPFCWIARLASPLDFTRPAATRIGMMPISSFSKSPS